MRVRYLTTAALAFLVTAQPAVSQEVSALLLEQPYAVGTIDLMADEGGDDDADSGEEEEEDDLDFLEDDIESIRSTQTSSGSGEMSAEVSSVSRTAQPIARTASAIYVVTEDMIRRSGATNIMDVLRTVPGVHVGRSNSGAWAISIRGMNGVYSNKLLVQIDGRAVYTPVFSGTFWDLQTVPLKDIQSIEVVRGPGGTVWGANAVNGVINITRKSSKDTTGVYAEVLSGDEHRSLVHARVGGQVSRDVTYRLYGMQLKDDTGYALPGPPGDGRRAGVGGFRLDWTPNCQDTFTLQGDFQDGETSMEAVNGSDNRATNFLTRWTRQIDDCSDCSVQMYYDHLNRVSEGVTGSDLNQNVFDLDTTYHEVIGYHDVVCGFGFRNYETSFHPGPGAIIDFIPPTSKFDIISYFIQDTMTLSEDLAYLTLGCKFEHNDFVGFVYQPAIKLAVTPDDETSIWTSVSRSIRTPSVADRDLTFVQPLGGGAFFRQTGNRAVEEEQAMTYEIGLRRQPTEKFYWDLAAYFSRYNDLIASQVTAVGFPFTDALTGNNARADLYGFEWWSTYEAAEWWRLRGSYSLYKEDFDYAAGISPSTAIEGTYPTNMVYLSSSIDLTPQMTWDVGFRYVDAFAVGLTPTQVPSYFEMDMRIAYRWCCGMELAVVGQNLLDDHHPEYPSGGLSAATEVERSIFAMLSYEY